MTWPRNRPASPSLSPSPPLTRSGWRLVARTAFAVGSHVQSGRACWLRPRAFASPVRTCQWHASALPRTPVIARRPPWLVCQRVHRYSCNKKGYVGRDRPVPIGLLLLSPSPRLVILLSRSLRKCPERSRGHPEKSKFAHFRPHLRHSRGSNSLRLLSLTFLECFLALEFFHWPPPFAALPFHCICCWRGVLSGLRPCAC